MSGGNLDPRAHVRSGESRRVRLTLLLLCAIAGLLLCASTALAGEPVGPPSIASTSVLEVRDDGASLAAEVDPRGLPTEYWFEYGACASPSSCAAVGFEGRTVEASLDPSFEVERVGAQVSGLSAGTTYHYRLVAENAQGRVGSGEEVLSTWGTGAFGLPDGRAWEMVSPPDKHGAPLQPIGEDWAIQASAGGGAIVYEALSPTESSSAGYPLYQPVLGTRKSGGGWSSHDLAIPHVLPTELSVGAGWEFRFFSEDLSHSIVQPMGPFTPCEPEPGVHQPCISPEATEQTAFLGSDYAGGGSGGEPCTSSCFTPLVTAANTPPGTRFGISPLGNECPPKPFCGPQLLDATPDLSHILLESRAALTPSSAPGREIPPDSLYEWSEGEPANEQLRLVSVLPGNSSQEALPAKENPQLGVSEGSVRQVISPDGNRVVFHAGGHLYLRENATQPQSPLGPGGECLAAGDACTVELGVGLSGSPVFQTANAEVTRIFFSAGSPTDLYEYDVAHGEVVPLTAAAGIVGSVIGASEDGSWIYFVANGALAPQAVNGACGGSATAECNLYAMHFDGAHWESPKLVAVLSQQDKTDWGNGAQYTELAARVSPDGRWLAFMSDRSLTGFDNRDAVSGEPDEEVYEYDAATGDLACASCNQAGSRPVGKLAEQIQTPAGGIAGGFLTFESHLGIAANLPPWTPSMSSSGAIYQSRYLSDSGRLFFDASDQLVPIDVNRTGDVYEFQPEGVPAGEHACSSRSAGGSVVFEPARSVQVEGRTIGEQAGCVGLISSGESAEESAFLDADETGSEVFFLTSGKLSGEDVDTARDVYVARECSSVSPCATPSATPPRPCDNEASCKAAPSPQPDIFGPSGSATFSGPGNPIQSPPVSAVNKKPSSLTRAQKLARALKACHKARGKRKRAACQKRAHKRYGVTLKRRAGR